MHSSDTHAVCRGCGLALKGKPYYLGGSAYHPRTNERCKTNYYGGFVYSRSCDFKASLELEQDMPGHGPGQTRLGCFAQQALERNWP
jgi:hypothetical protein